MNSRPLLLLFALALLLAWGCSVQADEWKEAPSEFGVDGLDKSQNAGGFPSGWKTYPFQKGKAKQVYQVQEEGGKNFIRAQDEKDLSVLIFKDFGWNLKTHPILKWRWRPGQLPEGAKEDDRKTNDSACGVYVAFGKISGVALKYVWSSTLPVGHVWEKEPGKFFIIVLASGSGGLNLWHSQQVNVMDDYKKYFKKDPNKNPSGIGLMSDGNAMHSTAACDYGDFSVSNP